jgi:hypothetical protein
VQQNLQNSGNRRRFETKNILNNKGAGPQLRLQKTVGSWGWQLVEFSAMPGSQPSRYIREEVKEVVSEFCALHPAFEKEIREYCSIYCIKRESKINIRLYLERGFQKSTSQHPNDEAAQKSFWETRVTEAKKKIEGLALEERRERIKQKEYIDAYVPLAVQALREELDQGEVCLQELKNSNSRAAKNFAKRVLPIFQAAHPELHAWYCASVFAQKEKHRLLRLAEILRKVQEQEPQDPEPQHTSAKSLNLHTLAKAAAVHSRNYSDLAVSGPSARYCLPRHPAPAPAPAPVPAPAPLPAARARAPAPLLPCPPPSPGIVLNLPLTA